jgi:hypothetical protein
MSLSRCAILNNPNNYILPSNLNFADINPKINKIIKKKTIYKNNNIQISFNGSLMKNDSISIIENKNEENKELEDDNFKFKDTIEFEYFKKIIFSRNCNYDLRNYLLNNFIFAITLLKRTDKNEIEDMIEYPQIIVEPIKRFKKKNKSKIKYLNENKEEILNQLKALPEFKNLLSDNYYQYNQDNQVKKKNLENSSSYESILSISNSILNFGKNNDNKVEKKNK